MCGAGARTRQDERKRDKMTPVRCYRRVVIVLAFQLLPTPREEPQPRPRHPLRPGDLGPAPGQWASWGEPRESCAPATEGDV